MGHLGLVLHRLAEEELWDAVTYYEERQFGLGFQLRREVEVYLSIIDADSMGFRKRGSGYRRVNLKRFPFYLPYVLHGEVIWILAVAHASRRPGYWSRRTP